MLMFVVVVCDWVEAIIIHFLMLPTYKIINIQM